jgi:hypothetical protein
VSLIRQFKRPRGWSEIEGAPGVQFYFNAEDVAAATANTWDDRTGNYKADIFFGNLSTPYSIGFNNTPTGGGAGKKCAFFQNDGTAVVRRVGNNAYPYANPAVIPSDWWMACVWSMHSHSNRSDAFLSTVFSAAASDNYAEIGGFSGFNFGQSRSEMFEQTRVGNGTWLETAYYNAPTPSATDASVAKIRHRLYITVLLGGTNGQCRMNGIPNNYRTNSTELKLFSPTGGDPTHGAFTIGSRGFVANTIMTGGVRAAVFGEGVFSTADIQRLEGILAWDAGIQNDLPNDHPYKLVAP